MTGFSLRMRGIVIGLSMLLPLGAVSPAQAVTCDEVRNLTPAQIDYWAKRLQVPPTHLDKLLKTAFCDARAQRTAASTPKPNSDRLR
jgi:hypothetical protein